MPRCIIIIMLCLVCAIQAAAPSVTFFIRKPAVAGAPYLINQNFEGTGYDNSETWTEILNGGTIDEDYTTTILAGSQSLLMTDSAFALGNVVCPPWSATTVTYGYFLLRLAARPAGASSILTARVSANVRVDINITGAGILRIKGNLGSYLSTVGALSGGTTYHIWWSVDATSSPETMTVGFSATGIRPTSGDNYVSGTSDMSGSILDNIRLEPCYSGNDTIFDRILVDDVQIGDNP